MKSERWREALVARRVTGSPLVWARDLALVGGVSALLAPATVLGLLGRGPDPWPLFCLGAGLVGALTGAMLGGLAPSFLEAVRGKVPIPALLLMGLGLGGAWGAVTGLGGAAAALLWPGFSIYDTFYLLGGLLAGSAAGLAMFGAFWFPYTFLTVTRRRTWPLVAAACLSTPLLGLLSLTMVMGGLSAL